VKEQWKVGDVVWFAGVNGGEAVECSKYLVEAVLDSKLVQLRSLSDKSSLRSYNPHLLRATRSDALSAFIEYQTEAAHQRLDEALRAAKYHLMAVAGAERLRAEGPEE
jgi:hypothetical protein